MKKIFYILLGLSSLFAGTTYAVAQPSFAPSLLPLTTATYFLGTTTPVTNSWKGIVVDQVCLTADSCRTTWPTGGAGSVGNWFSGFPNYNATGTTIGFSNGIFSIASSTFNASVFFSNVSQGFAGIGTNGLLYSFATSSIKTSQLTNDANFLATVSANAPLGGNGTAGSPLTCTTCLTSTFGFPFTSFPNYNATGTVIGFNAGLYSNSSTTLNGAIHFPSLSDGCLNVTSGLVGSTACSSGSAFPFTPTTNFNVNTNATGTPIWFKGSPSIFASSTSYLSDVNLANGSSTMLSAIGNLYANITGAKITLGGLPGAEGSFGGLWLAQNSPGSTNYLLLGSATQSFINAPSLDIESRIANVSRFQVGPNGVSINGMDNTAPPFPLQISNQEKTAVLGTMLNNGFFGLNTTTPVYNLTIASTTGPQLALSAGAGVGQWIFRNAGGNLYIASTTIDGLATSTGVTSAMTILADGDVGFGTTTPWGEVGIGSPTQTNEPTLSITTANTGNTTPAVYLDGKPNNGNADMAFDRGSNSGADANIDFLTSASLKWQLGLQNNSSDDFELWTGLDKPTLTIKNSTNNEVGIGSSSPFAKFGIQLNNLETTPYAFSIGSSTQNATTTLFTVGNNGSVSVNDISGDFRLETTGTLGNGYFGITNTGEGDIFMVDSNGKTGVSSSTPFGRLSVNPIGGDSIGFVVGSSTATQLSVSSLGFGTTTLSGLNVSGSATSTSNVGFNLTTGCYAINKVCLSTSGGSGITSLALGTGLVQNGTTITTTGSITGAFASTTQNPTIGRLAEYVSTGAGGTSINLLDVATNTPTGGGLTTITGTGATIGALTITTLYDPFPNHIFPSASATTTITGFGTTTPNTVSQMTISSSTASQLGLFAGTGVAGWAFRDLQNGNFFLGTTSISGIATTTTPAFTILSSNGNVGVNGTTTPTASLSINAPAQTQPYFLIGSTTSTVLSVNPPTGIGGIWAFGATSSPSARFTISAFYQDTFNANLFIVASSSVSATSTVFKIDNTGAIFAPNTSGSGGAQTGYWCYDANGQLIRDTVVCIAVSAKRFKYDIQPLHVGLSELMQLNPISYKLKPDYNTLFADNPNYNGTQYSFIADEVQKVDPKLVTVETATTTFEGVTYPPGTVHGLSSYENWVALLTQSILDVNKKVDEKQGTSDVKFWLLAGAFLLYVGYNEYDKRKRT